MRVAAAGALGRIGGDPAGVVPVLTAAVADHDPEVSCAAAEALGRYGLAAAEAEPALLVAIESWALAKDPRLPYLVAALRAVSPDPRARIREHFVGTDGEVRRLVLSVLREQGG